MSDTEQNDNDDELVLTPETVEDLDAEGDDVKGGVAGPPARASQGGPNGC